jgi:hypothetical protein
MGETLRRRFGPLPVWAWGLILVAVIVVYLKYRQNKAAQAAAQQQAANNMSTNLGTVPVSNLTTEAQPMPIQMGDTFVSTPVTTNVSPTTPVNITNNPPPSYTMQGSPPPAPSPAVNVGSNVGASRLPGYGANLGALLGLNPGLLAANTPGGPAISGITGYQVSYNGVPL